MAPKEAYTVKVGHGQTVARHTLAAPSDVRAFLRYFEKFLTFLCTKNYESSKGYNFCWFQGRYVMTISQR